MKLDCASTVSVSIGCGKPFFRLLSRFRLVSLRLVSIRLVPLGFIAFFSYGGVWFRFISVRLVPLHVGFISLRDQVWVHERSRRQGVATRLVDTVREKMVYGISLRREEVRQEEQEGAEELA